MVLGEIAQKESQKKYALSPFHEESAPSSYYLHRFCGFFYIYFVNLILKIGKILGY